MAPKFLAMLALFFLVVSQATGLELAEGGNAIQDDSPLEIAAEWVALEVDQFHVAVGETYRLTENTRILADEILVDGALLTAPSVSVALEGRSLVRITGEVLGGDGLEATPAESARGFEGQDILFGGSAPAAGSVILTAPVVHVAEGALVRGGDAAPGADAVLDDAVNPAGVVAIAGNGGRGGDVILHTPDARIDGELIPGDGGDGGFARAVGATGTLERIDGADATAVGGNGGVAGAVYTGLVLALREMAGGGDGGAAEAVAGDGFSVDPIKVPANHNSHECPGTAGGDDTHDRRGDPHYSDGKGAQASARAGDGACGTHGLKGNRGAAGMQGGSGSPGLPGGDGGNAYAWGGYGAHGCLPGEGGDAYGLGGTGGHGGVGGTGGTGGDSSLQILLLSRAGGAGGTGGVGGEGGDGGKFYIYGGEGGDATCSFYREGGKGGTVIVSGPHGGNGYRGGRGGLGGDGCPGGSAGEGGPGGVAGSKGTYIASPGYGGAGINGAPYGERGDLEFWEVPSDGNPGLQGYPGYYDGETYDNCVPIS